MWRGDGKCGIMYPLPDGAPSQCDPKERHLAVVIGCMVNAETLRITVIARTAKTTGTQ